MASSSSFPLSDKRGRFLVEEASSSVVNQVAGRSKGGLRGRGIKLQSGHSIPFSSSLAVDRRAYTPKPAAFNSGGNRLRGKKVSIPERADCQTLLRCCQQASEFDLSAIACLMNRLSKLRTAKEEQKLIESSLVSLMELVRNKVARAASGVCISQIANSCAHLLSKCRDPKTKRAASVCFADMADVMVEGRLLRECQVQHFAMLANGYGKIEAMEEEEQKAIAALFINMAEVIMARQLLAEFEIQHFGMLANGYGKVMDEESQMTIASLFVSMAETMRIRQLLSKFDLSHFAMLASGYSKVKMMQKEGQAVIATLFVDIAREIVESRRLDIFKAQEFAILANSYGKLKIAEGDRKAVADLFVCMAKKIVENGLQDDFKIQGFAMLANGYGKIEVIAADDRKAIADLFAYMARKMIEKRLLERAETNHFAMLANSYGKVEIPGEEAREVVVALFTYMANTIVERQLLEAFRAQELAMLVHGYGRIEAIRGGYQRIIAHLFVSMAKMIVRRELLVNFKSYELTMLANGYGKIEVAEKKDRRTVAILFAHMAKRMITGDLIDSIEQKAMAIIANSLARLNINMPSVALLLEKMRDRYVLCVSDFRNLRVLTHSLAVLGCSNVEIVQALFSALPLRELDFKERMQLCQIRDHCQYVLGWDPSSWPDRIRALQCDHEKPQPSTTHISVFEVLQSIIPNPMPQAEMEYCLGAYFVDIYCPQANIVIEVEGPVHRAFSGRTVLKKQYLEKMGYRVVKISVKEWDRCRPLQRPSYLQRLINQSSSPC